MNWVGGARNRVKLQTDKKRQKVPLLFIFDHFTLVIVRLDIFILYLNVFYCDIDHYF